jgi:hypothetical protein
MLTTVGVVRRGLGRLLLLRRRAEDQLGQRGHLLAQRGDLALQLDHPRPQGGVLGGQPLRLATPTFGLAAPILRAGASAPDRDHHDQDT